jgi:hypothetical protein
MPPVLLYLLLTLSFSLGSKIGGFNLPIYEGILIESDLIHLINQCPPPSDTFVPLQFDPIVFGSDTLYTIFIKLNEKVKSFSNSFFSLEKEKVFDSLVVRGYYPLIRKYRQTNERGYLEFLNASDPQFQLFVYNVEINHANNQGFTNLIESIFDTKRGIKREYSLFDHGPIAIKFVSMMLDFLLQKPLISQEEWDKRMDIMNLYFILPLKTKYLYEPTCFIGNLTKVAEKYRFLHSNFSISKGNVITISQMKPVYYRIRKFAKYDRPWNSFAERTEINERWIPIFRLYSNHLYEGTCSQMENLTLVDTRFICSTIVLKFSQEYLDDPILSFKDPINNLVSFAFGIIKSTVLGKLNEISSKCIAIDRLLQPEIPHETSMEKVNNFLMNYVKGDYGEFELSAHLNKMMVKVYLHLLQFDKMSSALKSFSSKYFAASFKIHPSVLTFTSDPANQPFITIIESFKPFCTVSCFGGGPNDPFIFGDNSLVSIFYNLMEMTKFLPFSNYNKELFDRLVEKFFYPMVVECYKVEPIKLLQLGVDSGFPFQVIIFIACNPQKSSRSFTKIIKMLRKREGNKEALNTQEESDFIMLAIKWTREMVMGLFRQPFKDWLEQRKIIRLHIDLLSKIKFSLNEEEEWEKLGISVPFEVEKYEYLYDNLTIIDGNQVEFFKKFQVVYQNLLKSPLEIKEFWIGTPKRPNQDFLLLLLFSIYSEHFLNSEHSLENLTQIDVKFLCSIALLRGCISYPILIELFKQKNPVKKARKYLLKEIFHQLEGISPQCVIIEKFLIRGGTLLSSDQGMEFFKKYLKGDYGEFPQLSGLSKTLVKVYLILEPFEILPVKILL